MDESNRQKSWRLSRLVWFAPAMEEQVQIRAARSKDVPQILAIYNAAVLEPASAYEDVPHTLTQREEWFEHFTRRNFPVVVAEHGSVVVGWGSLGPHQERAGFRFTGSLAVYVVRTHRRCGIGGELVEALLSAGRERFMSLLLRLIPGMKPALNSIPSMASWRRGCSKKWGVNSVNGATWFTCSVCWMIEPVQMHKKRAAFG